MTGSSKVATALRGLPGVLRGAARDLAGGVGDVVRDELSDLVLGTRCVGCERPGRVWCAACAPALEGRAYLTAPDPIPPGLPPIRAIVPYAGPARQAIVAHKDAGCHPLVGPLAAGLATALTATLDASRSTLPAAARSGPDVARVVAVVPVPSARAAIRERGDDPLGRIGRRATRLAASRLAASRLAAPDRLHPSDRPAASPAAGPIVRPIWWPALRVVRPVADQATLDSAGRAANLAGAFGLRPDCAAAAEGVPAVLVDDVVTTGATLAEAARALRGAGVRVIGAAVIAATERRGRA